MTNKGLKTISILSLTIFSFIGGAFAADLQAQIPADENSTMQTTETTQATPTQSCERSQKIQAKINELNTQKRADTINYNNALEKIKKITEKFEKEGYATSGLKKHSEELNQRIAQYVNSFTPVTTALRESQKYACDPSEDKFKQELQNARDALKKVRDTIGKVKNYYHDTIRTELLNPTKLNQTQQ